MIKVGFPRALLYYDYFPLWQAFFQNLGFEVVLSSKTNKNILDSGIKSCVDEACLPVKIFHGHVNYLKDKVDYIFIPRYISLHKKEYNCPKHLGIANMVINSIENLPPLITPKIDFKASNGFRKAAFEVGRIFACNYLLINKSYNNAIESHKSNLESFKSGIIPLYTKSSNKSKQIKLLVLGHSYNIFDDFINMGIINKLTKQNIELVFSIDVSEEDIRYYSDKISKRMFWSQGRTIIGSAFRLIENKNIDGIIYLSTFGCGLDSVLTHIVEKNSFKNNIPIVIMTFDEQTGEAGFNTRLEAFLDMMKWRNQNENNFSTSR